MDEEERNNGSETVPVLFFPAGSKEKNLDKNYKNFYANQEKFPVSYSDPTSLTHLDPLVKVLADYQTLNTIQSK